MCYSTNDYWTVLIFLKLRCLTSKLFDSMDRVYKVFFSDVLSGGKYIRLIVWRCVAEYKDSEFYRDKNDFLVKCGSI